MGFGFGSSLLIETGRVSEAKPLVEEALALNRKLHGEESGEVAEGLNALGNVALAEKDVPTAATMYRQSLAAHRKLTPLRITFLNPLHNLATFAISQGRPEEAEPLLREAAKFCRETIGENNITYGFVAGRLGLLDFLHGENSSATEKLRHCLNTVGLLYPKDDPDMVITRALLGLTLTRTGRPAEGEGFLRDALTVSKSVPRETFVLSTFNFESALGECLLTQGKYVEAEPLLQAGYHELKSRLGEKNPGTREAAGRLASLYEAWNKPDQAAPYRAFLQAQEL